MYVECQSRALVVHCCCCACSIDVPGMFETKGVHNASQRLKLVVGDVRQQFPSEVQDAQVGPYNMQLHNVVFTGPHEHKLWPTSGNLPVIAAAHATSTRHIHVVIHAAAGATAPSLTCCVTCKLITVSTWLSVQVLNHCQCLCPMSADRLTHWL